MGAKNIDGVLNVTGTIKKNGVELHGVTTAPAGTIVDVLGLDSNNNVVKGSAPSELPAATAADAGKMVAVNENGDLTLVNAPSGGTKLYRQNKKII